MVCDSAHGGCVQPPLRPLGRGGAWYEKLLDMSEEMAKSLSTANPLLMALYGLLCSDLGVETHGDAAHRQIIFDRIFSSAAFRTRGEKVSLRRWFGWLSSAHSFLPHWHSKLMGLVALGQVQGVYKCRADVPLWAPAVKPSGSTFDEDPPPEVIAADNAANDSSGKRAGTRKPDATLDPEAAASEKADKASHARASADASTEAQRGRLQQKQQHQLFKILRLHQATTRAESMSRQVAVTN